MQFSIFTIAAVVSMLTSALATPVAEAKAAAKADLAARKSIPFKISVSSPHRQTFAPEYTTCSGAITSSPADAAQYYFSDTPPFGVLFCSDSVTSGKMGFASNKHDFAVVDDATYAGRKNKVFREKFSLAEGTDRLGWHNRGLGNAKWVIRGGEVGEGIDADFGGFTTQDYIPCDLTAQF